MGAAGRTRGVRNQTFSDFEMILGSHFESLFGSDGVNSMFFSGLFPGHFLHRLEVLKPSFRRESIAKHMFLQKKRFLMIRGSFFCVVQRPLWCFS